MTQLIFTTKIVGLTFNDDYPNNVFSIAAGIATGDDSLDLVREPNNEFDSNAISLFKDGRKLGHVSKKMASFIAPQMDAGIEYHCSIEGIVVSQENPDQPGLKITIWSPNVE